MQDTATKRTPEAEQRIFFLSNNDQFSPNNGAILTNPTIIKVVMSSAAEEELGTLLK